MDKMRHFLYLWLWTPASWRNVPSTQLPEYPNVVHVRKVEKELTSYPPLIYAGECRKLKKELAKVGRGEKFLLMAGDCAESFSQFSIEQIMQQYRIFVQMSFIAMGAQQKPVVNIARIAGQFAKPRTNRYDIGENGETLPAYYGDIVNEMTFDWKKRRPNPQNMIRAYHQSCQTLNLLRALHSSDYASLARILEWNRGLIEDWHWLNKIESNLRFLDSLHISEDIISKIQFYTGHECLLLPYEESLTRRDSITGKYYDCSSHFLWIGERTRNISHAHVEFVRGLENPVGIKISADYDKYDIRDLIEYLNPTNEEGKITLITRMGCDAIKDALLPLVQYIGWQGYKVQWVCDPMHGNTRTLPSPKNMKTRFMYDIKKEIYFFVETMKFAKLPFQGIHLEACGQNVTECVGSEIPFSHEGFRLTDAYKSQCDPRLNARQSLELMLWLDRI